MLIWIERIWGLCHDFVPWQTGTRFLSAHTAAWSASLQKIGNGSLLLVQKQDINNSLRKHKHNYAEEYSCNLLETAECQFFPRFLDKNRRIHNDRWRMNKSTSKNFFDFFFICFCSLVYEVMQSDHSINSLQHNRLFVFILFPKKIYDLSVSMVLEIVYQK